MKKIVNKPLWLIKTGLHVGALLPIILLFINATHDELGADPVIAVIHFLGIGAFNCLLLTLLISPVAKRLKSPLLMSLRRPLGLYVFAYALLHVLSYIAFDLQFDWALTATELTKRPYIVIGLVALILLLLLSITSITAIRKKMRRSWQTLHNWIYVIAVLTAIHFYWSVKSDVTEPLVYFMLVTLLLSFRWKKFRRWLIKRS